MNARQQYVLNRLHGAQKNFHNSKFQSIVERAWKRWDGAESCINAVCNILNKLPTDQQLLSSLLKKLKGKSVVKTFERIGKGETSDFQELKSISSLLTHVVIECEHGNLEYRKLIPLLLEKINNVAYRVLSN